MTSTIYKKGNTFEVSPFFLFKNYSKVFHNNSFISFFTILYSYPNLGDSHSLVLGITHQVNHQQPYGHKNET